MEIRKLRILLVMLVCVTFWGVIRLSAIIEDLDPASLRHLKTFTSQGISRALSYQTRPEISTTPGPRHEVEWHQVLKFNFSVEPETERRRIPTRFWINSPQKVNNDLYYIITPKTMECNQDIQLLILVKSAMMHFEQRKIIRQTWGSVTQVGNHKIRILYLLGKRSSSSFASMHSLFENESMEYDDILVGNFVDAYTNVTKKTLLGLKFAHEFCRNVEFVLNADDDIYLNTTDMIMQHFPNINHPASKALQCGLQTVKLAKVKRKGKWGLDERAYDRPYYPPYCLGPCYLMSIDVAIAAYEASLQTPTDISVDDVVITGILREKIGINLSSMSKGICVHLSNAENVVEKLIEAWKGKA